MDLLEAAREAKLSERDDLEAWVATQPRELLEAAAVNYLTAELRRVQRVSVLWTERQSQQPAPTTPRLRPLIESEAEAAAAANGQRIAALREAVDVLVDRHADDLLMDWTPRLLAEEVRLPDGRRTTWGLATVAEHGARAAMFADQATAGIEGAARHRKAIEALTDAGVDTLDALTEKARSATDRQDRS